MDIFDDHDIKETSQVDDATLRAQLYSRVSVRRERSGFWRFTSFTNWRVKPHGTWKTLQAALVCKEENSDENRGDWTDSSVEDPEEVVNVEW